MCLFYFVSHIFLNNYLKHIFSLQTGILKTTCTWDGEAIHCSMLDYKHRPDTDGLRYWKT